MEVLQPLVAIEPAVDNYAAIFQSHTRMLLAATRLSLSLIQLPLPLGRLQVNTPQIIEPVFSVYLSHFRIPYPPKT